MYGHRGEGHGLEAHATFALRVLTPLPFIRGFKKVAAALAAGSAIEARSARPTRMRKITLEFPHSPIPIKARAFITALGTKDPGFTSSGSLLPSAERSEQWALPPKGPSPSRVGPRWERWFASLSPPRGTEMVVRPIAAAEG